MEQRFLIAEELRRKLIEAQSAPIAEPRGSPIPPMLWIGDGTCINASYEIYELIHRYADLFLCERENLATMVTDEETSNSIAHRT